MSGEKNDTPPKEEINNTENYDALDDILDDKKDVGEKDDKKDLSDDKKNEEAGKDKPDEFYKKVGNREFKSSDDYDEYVLKISGLNSNFSGEIKRLGGDPNSLGKKEEAKEADKKEVEKKTEETKEVKQLTDDELFYKFEKVSFTRQFPDAKDYAEEMALSLRSGKANINGNPSFAFALARSLRADNKPIPEKLIQRIKSEKGEDEKVAVKKVMKSGGGNSAPAQSGQESYSEDEMQETSDFANKIALGNVRMY